MRYLSVFGSDGFRTFRGVVSGKLAYVPEKIPTIDPEIFRERDYSLRLHQVIAPYTDNHPKLPDALAILPQHIGSLVEVSQNYAIWRPKTHLSLFSQHLLASLFETFIPDQLTQPLNFVADLYDNGLAFAEAFSLEQKNIYLPISISFPESYEKTKIHYLQKNSFLSEAKEILNKQSIRFDSMNIFRIVGHLAMIVNVLYETEKTRFRFFNDPVCLALPADDIEFLLAAYYLAQSDLPIKKIYAVSSHHRMIHNFLAKGEFTLQGSVDRADYFISLFRLLFEASNGSIEKITRWKKELKEKASFKIDSTTLTNIQKIITPVFTTKLYTDTEFSSKENIPFTKLNKTIFKISQESKELILAFDIE